MRRLLPLVLAAGAVAVAALAANVLLVGYASNRDDPVGKLSPRAPQGLLEQVRGVEERIRSGEIADIPDTVG